ncbi:MAG: polyisoprenoid-binding protein [Chloroflexi bacterium]|nr:polyisoprenoid-binding protein [Chloroflexota bacterium]
MASASNPVAPGATGTVLYTIDPAHTMVEFTVRHMMVTTVKGRFTRVSGEIWFDEADPTRSSVTASVEVASIDTGDPNRDTHLRSADFFEAEKYPTITFTSRRIEKTGPDTYRVIGDLTMHGVTREVVFDATYFGQAKDPWGGTRIGLSATTTINRRDFNLNWNVALEAGGVLVSDQVRINLDVQAVRKQ